MTMWILLTVIVGLFFASFFSKRRFGLLGLGLAGGAMLNNIWGDNIRSFVLTYGSPLGDYTTVVISSLVILLPAIALLFHGYTYESKLSRGFSSLLFAIFALALLCDIFGPVSGLTGDLEVAYQWFISQKIIIAGVALVVAVVDVFFASPALDGKK